MDNLEPLLQRVSDQFEENKRIISELQERNEKQPDPLNHEQIRAIVAEMVSQLDGERKMRFSRDTAGPDLYGTKFARYGLTLADVELLYDIQNSMKGQPKRNGGTYRGPSEELENTFNALSAAVYMPMDKIREMDRRALDDIFPRVPKSGWLNRALGRQERIDQAGYERALRAMDSAESGYGSQLIGAQYVGDLWEAARPDSRVFPLIESVEMQHPTQYIPIESDLPEMLFVSENTANNSSDYSTDKTGSQRVQVDAKKQIVHQMWSGEMEEDSIIPYIPFLRRQTALSLAHYSDSLLLNGDTTNAGTGNINLDDADPADTKHYLAFDGIRHAAIVDNTANVLNVAAALQPANIQTLRSYMADAAANVPMHWGFPTMMTDLVLVTDFSTYQSMLQWDEVLTVDKYGAGATILTGELGRIWGIPVIPSQAMSLTEADGKVSTTGSNNTLGQIVLFNRRAFRVGWRRRIQLETERLPGRDQTRLIYSMRLGFGRYSTTGAASGIEAVAVGRNITV